MKKVTITISDEIWKWWKDNPWINLSQLAERELSRIRALEERVLGTCPECGQRLVLVKGEDKLYFGCPDLMSRKCKIQKVLDNDLIRRTIVEMKIKCSKCQSGFMKFRLGRLGPFLGCSNYSTSKCRSTMDFDEDPQNS